MGQGGIALGMQGCRLTRWGSLCSTAGRGEAPSRRGHLESCLAATRNQILQEKLSLFLTSDANVSLAENKDQG